MRKDSIKDIIISRTFLEGDFYLTFPAPLFFELFIKYLQHTEMEEDGTEVVKATLDKYYECKSVSLTSIVTMKGLIGVTRCLEKFFWETNLPYLSRIELDPKTFKDEDANEIKLGNGLKLKAPQSIINTLRANRVETSEESNLLTCT